MSTVQLAHEGAGALSSPHARASTRAAHAANLLGAGLVVVIAYGAFAHGATTSPAETRLQVGIDLLAALAGAGLIWSGTLRISAPKLAWVGIGLLVGFAAWNAITILWSIAPNQSWLEFNRSLSYVVVLVLAVTLGASTRGAMRLAGSGFLLVSLAVTCYGLGQKLLPGLRVSDVFNLNQTSQVTRLEEPLGYWNALALFIAMGVPMALALMVDQTRSARIRLGSLVSLQLLMLALGFTQSLGGVLALLIGLGVGIGLSGARLRSLLWIAAAALATAPPLAFGLAYSRLTRTNVSLGHRELAGLMLAGVLALSLLALLAGGRKLLALERDVPVGPERSRRIGLRLLALAVALLVVLVAAVSLSSRGLPGTISHTWKSFTATRGVSVSDPSRLLSADSQNRWVWWKEAAGGFSARPLAGWGAGSFGVVHRLYRRDTISVRQPHSVPLQFLVETGLIGAVLAIGGLALLMAVGVGAVRRHVPGPERLLAAALLAGVAMYAVHSLYDWDWDIPGVTLPAMLFLGVLAGSLGAGARRSGLPGPGAGLRALALAALTLCLCVAALSAALPGLAASKADAALLAASTPGGQARAQDDATLAARLDPLSDAGPRAQATIALRGGARTQAIAYLREAVRREPSDEQAWIALTYAELAANDSANARRSADRALALDPRSQIAGALVQGVTQPPSLSETPPAQSATSVP